MPDARLKMRPELKDWIDSRVATGEFASAEAYLSDLVERDIAAKGTAEERIAALRQIVEDAERSGVSERTNREIFAEAVAVAKARGTYRD